MSVNLGTIFAEARLNTQGYRQGASEVASISRAIGASLASIGTTSIGFALGGAISQVVSSIGSIPKALVDANASVEKDTLSMAAQFDAAANAIQTSWAEGQAFVAESTEKETAKVADVVRNIERAYEDAGRAATEFARQAAEAQANQGRAIANVQQRASDFVQDITRSQERGAADFESKARDIAATRADIQRDFEDAIAAAHKAASAAIAQADRDYDQASAGIARQMKKVATEFARSNETRLRDFRKAQADLAKESQKSATQLADSINDAATASTERARAMIQSLGQQLTALRNQELQQSLSHAQQLEDLAARELGALTPEQRSALAQEKLRLQALQALQQQELEGRRNAAKQVAQEQINTGNAEADRAVAAARRRVQEELQAFNERNAELQKKYDEDTENATQAYDDQLEELRRSLEEAEQIRSEAAAKAAAAESAAIEAAKKQQKERLEALQKQEQELAQTKQRAAEDDQRRLERERRDREQTTAEINRGLKEALEGVERSRETSTIALERALDDMRRRQTEAEKELTQSREEAMQKLASRQSEFANAFSAPWIDQANAINDKFKLPFHFTLTTDGLDKARQMVEFSEAAAQQLPLSASQIREAMTRMIQTGLDPTLERLRTLAAFSLKPTVTGGITQLVQAFGSLASGQGGEGVQRLREAGIPLERIAGLKFNAQGSLITPLQDAMKIIFNALGPEAEATLNRFKGSWELMISNLGDAKDRLTRIIGEGLFEVAKREVTNFTQFLETNKGAIEQAAREFGENVGRFAQFVADRFKDLTAPENVAAFRGMLDQIGAIKDQIIRIVGDILGALTKFKFTDTAAGADALASAIDKLDKAQFSDLEQQLADMGVTFFDIFESGDDVDTMRSKLTDFFNAKSTEGEGVAGTLDKAAGKLGELASALEGVDTSTLAEDFTTIRKSMLGVADVINTLSGLAQGLGAIFSEAGKGVRILETTLNEGAGIFEANLNRMIIALEPWTDATRIALRDTGQFFSDLGTAVDKAITYVVQSFVMLPDKIKEIDWFGALNTWFGEQWAGLVKTATEAFDKLPDGIKAILTKIYGGSIFEEWIKAAEEFLPDEFASLAEQSGEAFSGVANAIGETLDGVTSQFEGAVASISKTLDTVRAAAGGAISGIGGAIAGAGAAITRGITTGSVTTQAIPGIGQFGFDQTLLQRHQADIDRANAIGAQESRQRQMDAHNAFVAQENALRTQARAVNTRVQAEEQMKIDAVQSAEAMQAAAQAWASVGWRGEPFGMANINFGGAGSRTPGLDSSIIGTAFVNAGSDAIQQWAREWDRARRGDIDAAQRQRARDLQVINAGQTVTFHHNTFNENGVQFVTQVAARLEQQSRRKR